MCAVRAEHICRTLYVRSRAISTGGRTRLSSNRQPLRVIKDVERLGSKFEAHPFGDRKALKQRHIEVEAVWVAKAVPARVPKAQCRRNGIGKRIVEEWAVARHKALNNAGSWVANDIRVGLRRNSVSDACIIRRKDHTKRRAS